MKRPDAMSVPSEGADIRANDLDDVVEAWFARFRVGLDANTHNHFRAAVEELKATLRAALQGR